MSRFQQILAGVLTLQIILAAVVFWPRTTAGTTGVPLLSNFLVDEVVELSIESGNGDSISFQRDGAGWLLADSGYRALSANVDALLENLALVETGQLVTQTASSHKRLKVADDDFERLIKLTLADNTTRSLLIGTAPTAQSVHVRVPNQDETWVSSVVTTRDVDPASRNWVETVYYTLNQDDIAGIVVENGNGRFELVKLGSGESAVWSFTDLQPGEAFNEAGLRTLLGRVASIRFNEPLGQTEQPSYQLGNPAAIVTVNTTSGPQQLVIGQAAAGADPVVKWSDSPFYVTVSAFNAEPFTNADRSNFVTQPPVDNGE